MTFALSLFIFVASSAYAVTPVVNIQESYDAKTQKASSVVTLRNGKKLQDVGFTLTYLGEMSYKNHSALLFRGVICADCSVDLSLFVQPLFDGARKTQFTLPGRITSVQSEEGAAPQKNSVMLIRSFFGDCLKNGKSSLINYKETLGVPEKTVEVWGLNEKGDLVFVSSPKDTILKDVLLAVKEKKCTEIHGADRDVHEE